jgi:hypothetical protein
MSRDDELKNQIVERIKSLSDEDLIKILREKRNEYTPFALEVAQQELSKRGGKDKLQERMGEKNWLAVSGLEHIKSLRGSPKPEGLFEPFMPDVELFSDMSAIFGAARNIVVSEGHKSLNQDSSSHQGQRCFVIVTPGRMLMSIPTVPSGDQAAAIAKVAEEIFPSGKPLNISVISYTYVDALLEDMTKCIPFLGYLFAFSYSGHNIIVFEGHPSAFESGIRDSDILLVDSGMEPFLPPKWAETAFAVMRENAKIFIHNRETYTLSQLIRKEKPKDQNQEPWWKLW